MPETISVHDVIVNGEPTIAPDTDGGGAGTAYTTGDPASTTINDTDYVPMSDSSGNRKKSLWSNIVNKLKSAFVPLITNTGIGEIYGRGQYQWGKIAIITVASTYTDGPVVFEVSQRKYAFSILQVSFKNSSGVDPELEYFTTNNDNHYYIKKVGTGTWELYAKYSESYGGVALHRVTGYRVNSYINVTLVMENVAEPTGVIQVSNTISGDITYKFNDADLTKANNNVSSVQYPTTFNILDVGDRIFARMEGKVHPNGDTGTYWYIRNYNTSGAQVAQKGIEMRMTKDGTFSYLVEEASKFRSAINAAYSSANNGVADTANGVKDYYATSMVTKFGYGSPGMAQSAVTWLGAWDATVSGEYRLRGVRQADLKVAHAANAIKYDEIFSGYCSAANTFQTKSLMSGKKFSDYRVIIIESRQYGNATQVYVETLARFQQHNGVDNRAILQAVTGEQYQVYYVSDTQICMAQSQISGAYLSLHLYGVIGA